jgi:hypothetical protein
VNIVPGMHTQPSRRLPQPTTPLDTTTGLALIIFYTARHANHVVMKLALFTYSLIGGSFMIHTVNNEGYLVVISRSPALGTLWVWSIVQLDLLPAVISLVGVAAYVRWKGLNIIW